MRPFIIAALFGAALSVNAQAQWVYVEPGQTMLSIARQAAPYADNAELRRWVVAFHKLNPDAFIDGNIHNVRADFPLQVPSRLQVEQVPEDEARSSLRVPLSTLLAKGLGGLGQPEAPAHSDEGSHHKRTPRFSPFAEPAEYDETGFKADPIYDQPYDADVQIAVYGGKTAQPTPRPLLELGYPMYAEGLIGSQKHWLGSHNPVTAQFLVYGDIRFASGMNHRNGDETGQLAMRFNLDTDLKLTGTERLHVLFRPTEKDGKFTRYQYSDGANNGYEGEFDLAPVTAFIEGDLASLTAGFMGEAQKWDMPFAVGLMPLFMQNGIWLDDTILGAAFTIPARNSARWNISNMDTTFFFAIDDVDNQGISGSSDPNIAGVAFFGDMWDGYVEADYAYVHDTNSGSSQSHHSVALAYSGRWANHLSNSVRLVGSFGQRGQSETADGWLLLIENSFMTSKPYTVLPYLNFFVGQGTPQALASQAGILKNTGLNFETDAITGFQSLTATGHDSAGFATGLEFLFNLDQQLVFEAAGQRRIKRGLATTAAGEEYAIGIRWQKPISPRWILRADAVRGWLEELPDFTSFRVEVRVKF